MKEFIFATLVAFAGSRFAIAFPQGVGTVKAKQKISETAGGLGPVLDAGDEFGGSVAALGDLDGDGTGDVAVGAYRDDDGGVDQGAVWILFLDADGTVKAEQKISETTGGLGSVLDNGDTFGFSACSLGDLDGDGIEDLAVGAQEDDGVIGNEGAVWILFLDTDGTVKAEQKISQTSGGFGGSLDPSDLLGCSVACLGDLDGDGVGDLAAGARNDDDGGTNQGAMWILFLNANGTVKAQQKISETVGGFGGVLDPGDFFGLSSSSVGDLDGDGVTDLAVGAPFDDDGGTDQGAVWILFLNADGTVKAQQKISETTGGLGGVLSPGDNFGASACSLGDLDSDGTPDLAIGVPWDDDGGSGQGAVWVLFLNPNGTVLSKQKISETVGGFGGGLDPGDVFGWSATCLGDLDADGVVDLALGAIRDDDGVTDQGAAWVLFLNEDTTPPTLSCPPSIAVLEAKTSPPGEVVFFTVTASDDHDPAPTVSCVPPSGSFFPRGTTLVTCTATDDSGNQSVCVFPVVVLPTVREHGL